MAPHLSLVHLLLDDHPVVAVCLLGRRILLTVAIERNICLAFGDYNVIDLILRSLCVRRGFYLHGKPAHWVVRLSPHHSVVLLFIVPLVAIDQVDRVVGLGRGRVVWRLITQLGQV